MDNLSLVTEWKVEHLFENAGRFIDRFVGVHGNALFDGFRFISDVKSNTYIGKQIKHRKANKKYICNLMAYYKAYTHKSLLTNQAFPS